MEDVYRHIYALNTESINLCYELQRCLIAERRLLVEFKIEELPHLSLQKESIALSITRKRKELREFIQFHFKANKPSELVLKLDGSQRDEWEKQWKQWCEVWKKTRVVCDYNQRFLKHSLKNLGLLVENLKKLLGDHSLYSNQGKRIDMQKEGRVVEGRY